MLEPITRMPCACNCCTSSRVSVPASFAYCDFLPSSPIHTHDTPSATSCSMSYFRSTFAELKT